MKTSLLHKPARLAQIAHTREKGLDATIVRREAVREFHITIQPLPGDSTFDLVQRLHAFVSANNAQIVWQEVFGLNSAFADFLRIQKVWFRRLNWPITCVQASSCDHVPVCGLQTFAVAGAEVEPLFDDSHAVGAVFSDGWARHCLLGDIIPKSSSKGRENQSLEVFQKMARYLDQANMAFTDIARTWLFLDDILGWYGLFNKERREFFELHDVFSHCVPASTGIGAANSHRASLVASAWAVQPFNSGVTVQAVDSPLQCSARNYGSCFSRAVEISSPDLKRLFISGTASIAPDGRTQFVDDVRGQVARTMEVVDAILISRGMHWWNTSRATVYFKRTEDAWAYSKYALEHELNLPVLVTEADVCRQELLFEIEVDAISCASRREPGDWEI